MMPSDWNWAGRSVVFLTWRFDRQPRPIQRQDIHSRLDQPRRIIAHCRLENRTDTDKRPFRMGAPQSVGPACD